MSRYKTDEAYRIRRDMWSRVGRLKRQIARLDAKKIQYEREIHNLLKELKATPRTYRRSATGKFI